MTDEQFAKLMMELSRLSENLYGLRKRVEVLEQSTHVQVTLDDLKQRLAFVDARTRGSQKLC